MILHNVRLIDGTGRVWERAAIRIEGDRIAEVVSAVADAAAVPGAGGAEGTDILDLEGLTVIPGLINCHTHLCLDASADAWGAWAGRSITENVLVAAQQAEAALQAGITTVRDLGGVDGVDLGLKKAINGAVIPGPRMLVSGRVLCMTGGQAHFMGREVDGPDEVRKGAREQLKAGADIIKVMATGGVLTAGVEPGSAQLTYEEMRAAIEEAGKAGKLTASHAQGTVGIKNSVRAGIDSIEHGIFLDSETIDMMLERGTFFVPTLAALYQIVEAWPDAGIPAHAVEKTKRVKDAHLDSFGRAREAGVRIVAGNDGGTPFNPSSNLVRELELLVESGMTPTDALDAVNRSAAELLRMEGEIGTVEPGKVADLVVLGSDPLADISALRDVRMVIQGGQLI